MANGKTDADLDSASSAPILKIGHIAQMLGVSAARLRLWEDEGLITPTRTESGQRRYSMRDLRHLERVRRLLDSGEVTFAGVRASLGSTGTEDSEDEPVEKDGTSQPDVGARAKLLRQRSGLSLRDVAGRIDMSPSALSAFERGNTSPNIGRLTQIAHAIGVTTNELLGVAPENEQIVVRRNRRKKIVDSSGVVIENLYLSTTALQSQMVTVKPDCGSGHPMTHDGEEFLTVVEGSLEVVLDATEIYVLNAGDSMNFESTRPHSYRNPGTTDVRVVWVNTPPTF
ncbi:MerR family transcriptional regulator [Gordonia westfalica]|uniref:DNA-binding transcriptional regulator, MerR family n=1 Tax=Gordonia westfalica TaxID=158898 RepID=A0A1H2KXQ4_9ACTN|nr:MerR family transcriptional regulator [Gordonia westfalica]MDS1113379.1 MerR family transcriptional regulator [Gordonia westfalica]SDU73121.1 DNA-binding transcriptional regulator, MerR family [Gordonia westfalica]